MAQRQIPLNGVRNFEPRENARGNEGNEGSRAGKEGQGLTRRRSKKRIRLSNTSSEGDSSNASNHATDGVDDLAAQVAALTKRLDKTEAELREVKASAAAPPGLQGAFDLQGLVPALDPTVATMLSAEKISRRTDILNLRAELRKEIGDLGGRLKKEMGDLRGELKKEIEDLGGELKKDLVELEDLRGEWKKEIGDLRGELKIEINDLGNELRKEIVEKFGNLKQRVNSVRSRAIDAQTIIAKVSTGVFSV